MDYEIVVRFFADDERQAGKLAEAIYEIARSVADNVTVGDPETITAEVDR